MKPIKFFNSIFLGLILYIVVTSLQGCLIGDGCEIPSASDQSEYRADPEWTKKNLDKDAFEFECVANVYPPSIGSNGKIVLIVSIAVKDIYLDVLGRPNMSNIAQIRADALYRAKQTAINDIKNTNPNVKEVDEVICRETKMLPPNVIGQCKVSENDQNPSDDVELPTEGPNPLPIPTSTSGINSLDLPNSK